MGHPSAFVEITLGWVPDHSALFEKRGIYSLSPHALGSPGKCQGSTFSVSPTRAKEHDKVLPSTHKRLLSSCRRPLQQFSDLRMMNFSDAM